MHMERPASLRHRALAATLAHPAVRGIALFLPAVVAFMPALFAGEIWDDAIYISDNPYLRSPQGLVRIWTQPFQGPVWHYLPLTFSALWVQYLAWGDAPLGYHAVSLALHGIVALMVWRLGRRVEARGAWLGAALFAVHPAQAASVAWMTEQKTLLCAAFFLASLLAWDAYARSRREGFYLVALVACAAALLSKSMAVALGPVVCILAWWRPGWRAPRFAWRVAPFFALALAAGILGILVHRQPAGGGYDLSLADRVLVAGRAWWFYLYKIAWPAEHMGVYPQWRIDPQSPVAWLWPLSAATFFAILALAGRRWGRAPLAAFAICLAVLLPVLGLVEYSVMMYSWVHDHHLYLACAAPLMLAAAAAVRLAERLRLQPRHGLALCALVLGVAVVVSLRHSLLFRDMPTYFRHNLRHNPRAWPALSALGAHALTRGETSRAQRLLQRALDVREAIPQAHSNMAVVRIRQRRYADALRHAERAIELGPADPAGAAINRALALEGLGRLEEAQRLLESAFNARPADRRPLKPLHRILAKRGEYAKAEALRRFLDAPPPSRR